MLVATCPRQLDFGVLLVNNQTTKDLTLVNNSDSDIRYELTYVCYPLAADGSPEKAEDQAGLHVVPMLTQSKDHTLTVNLPSGVLPARSKTVTRVRLTQQLVITVLSITLVEAGF